MAEENKTRDISKHPFKTHKDGILKAMPLLLWWVRDEVRVGVGVYKSEKAYNAFEPPLPEWQWTKLLNAKEKELYAKELSLMAQTAIGWLRRNPENFSLTVLAVNLEAQQLSATCHCTDEWDLALCDTNTATNNFETIVANNPNLVEAFNTLVWNVALASDERFKDFE